MSNHQISHDIGFNNWFTPSVEYRGRALVTLSDPERVITGSGVVRCRESGETTVDIYIAESFSGGHLADPSNDFQCCRRLEVTTDGGTFETSDVLVVSWSLGTDVTKVTYTVKNGLYRAAPPGEAMYWVAALVNLYSSFHEGKRQFEHHPLLIWRPRRAHHGQAPGQFRDHENPLIVFSYRDKEGFIEPLPDYKERTARLEVGDAVQLITAVMVGEIAGKPDLSEVSGDWFPFPYLLLLSVATGTRVGCAWIELRGADGALIQRLHRSYPSGMFSVGPLAIDEKGQWGSIGAFLTDAQQSRHFRAPWMFATLNNIIAGSRNDGFLNERLLYLLQAFECLALNVPLGRPSSPQSKVGQERQERVRALLRGTRDEIVRTANRLREEGTILPDEQQAMHTLAEYVVERPWVKVDRFEDDALLLLRKFGLSDAEALVPFLRAHYSELDGWGDMVAKYRRQLTQHGIIGQGEEVLPPPYAFYNHLNDVLLRVLFKLFGYHGEYRPAIPGWQTSKSIDWVRPDTPPIQLGYTAPEE